MSRALTPRLTTAISCLLLAASAHADEPACSITSGPLQCRLDLALHLLDTAAVLLVLLLIAVVIFLVAIYRKNRAPDPLAQRSKPRNPEQ